MKAAFDTLAQHSEDGGQSISSILEGQDVQKRQIEKLLLAQSHHEEQLGTVLSAMKHYDAKLDQLLNLIQGFQAAARSTSAGSTPMQTPKKDMIQTADPQAPICMREPVPSEVASKQSIVEEPDDMLGTDVISVQTHDDKGRIRGFQLHVAVVSKSDYFAAKVERWQQDGALVELQLPPFCPLEGAAAVFRRLYSSRAWTSARWSAECEQDASACLGAACLLHLLLLDEICSEALQCTKAMAVKAPTVQTLVNEVQASPYLPGPLASVLCPPSPADVEAFTACMASAARSDQVPFDAVQQVADREAKAWKHCHGDAVILPFFIDALKRSLQGIDAGPRICAQKFYNGYVGRLPSSQGVAWLCDHIARALPEDRSQLLDVVDVFHTALQKLPTYTLESTSNCGTTVYSRRDERGNLPPEHRVCLGEALLKLVGTALACDASSCMQKDSSAIRGAASLLGSDTIRNTKDPFGVAYAGTGFCSTGTYEHFVTQLKLADEQGQSSFIEGLCENGHCQLSKFLSGTACQILQPGARLKLLAHMSDLSQLQLNALASAP